MTDPRVLSAERLTEIAARAERDWNDEGEWKSIAHGNALFHCTALLAHITAMTDVLRDVEWAGDDGCYCPSCDHYTPKHAPVCKLAALLSPASPDPEGAE